jgi:hypothetical protein
VSTKIQPFSVPEGMHAIKIRADAKFWRHWRGDSEQMQQIGYRCRKVGAAGMRGCWSRTKRNSLTFSARRPEAGGGSRPLVARRQQLRLLGDVPAAIGTSLAPSYRSI